jgi:hypothetical protein
MAEIEQKTVADIFAEIGALKLMLYAILKGSIPREKPEAWAEIEAMVTVMETAAKSMAVDGADKATSDDLVNRSLKLASQFTRSLSPKF